MESLLYGKEMMIIVVAYALGCFTTGYYLVRIRTGRDIRLCGSGSVGAKNVGRVLGRPGFLITLAGDFAKGALAVWLAEYFRLHPVGVMLAMLAAVAGHLWPAQLRCSGGKGVAASLGAVMVYDPTIALTLAGLFAAAFVIMRNFVFAGLMAFAITPLVLFGLEYPLPSVFGMSALALLILIAHRKNVREELAAFTMDGKLKGEKRAASK